MNKILKKAMLFFMLIVFAIGCVGCGKSKEISNSTNEISSDYPLSITDSFEREVTLDKVPERIVSIAPNITELIYEIGAGDKLVGRTDYCDYPEEVKDVESIGNSMTPDIEKIIGLDPDLVITSAHFSIESLQKLESAGIKVLELYEEKSIDGVYTITDILGKALNKKEEAEKVVSEMKTTINNVSEKVSGFKAPTVYYVVGYGESGDFSAPENSFVGNLIELAGGKDVVPASDSWAYSLEALIESDPDIIVLRNGEKERFISTPGYKDLPAVKNDKVYEVDEDLLDRQGFRNAEGVKVLAKIFHPEAFK